MYEEFIARIIIKQIKSIIISSFAQLYGKDSNYYIRLYLDIKESKVKLVNLSGLPKEIVDKITALIGEKNAAKIGHDFCNTNNVINSIDISRKSFSDKDKKEEALQILEEQLLILINHKINQERANTVIKLTIAELKLAKVIGTQILKKILRNKKITLATEVDLKLVQNIVGAANSKFIQLVKNHGRVDGRAVKISQNKDMIISQLNSALGIMNAISNKGVKNELIVSPDFTPNVFKGSSRAK